MRVCLVYDCLFPHTIGGAERWYRDLAEGLAGAGHEVTYLTLRQWEHGAEPDIPGVRVIAVGPRMELYVAGRRRIGPPLRFGAGVLWHLLRHGRRYDVVHTASFPYFSLLAAGALAPLCGYRIVVDWFEVWSREYWREYLGRAGAVGLLIQSLCARVPQRAFCWSRLHAERLAGAGLRVGPEILGGAYAGPLEPSAVRPAERLIVFAGRLIPEKRAAALIPALAALPDLRAEIFGEGPERDALAGAITAHGVGDRVALRGFVSSGEVEDALARALCMVLPSRREGYGMIVVEASSHGTPSVVVAEPDNAASELIEDGVNGVLAASIEPADLAAAIQRVDAAGAPLRVSTAAWFAANARRLSLAGSIERVLASYGGAGELDPNRRLMPERVKFYMFPGSNSVMTGRLMLEHKGVDYETVMLPPAAHAFIMLGLGFESMTVPALKIDGRRVQGTRFISRALDQLVPERPLFPADPDARRAVEDAERWGEDFQNATRRIMYCAARRDRRAFASVVTPGRSLPMRLALRALSRPIVRLASGVHRASDDAGREDIALLAERLDQIDAWIASGLLGAAELNAADFQIAPNISALLLSDDLAPFIAGRPAQALAQRVAPGYQGHANRVAPPDWLEPLEAHARTSGRT